MFSDSSPLPRTLFFIVFVRRLWHNAATQRGKFWSSFFKSLRGGGRRALLAVRRRRNSPNGVSLLLSFSLCTFCVKEKSGNDFLCRYAAIISSTVGRRLVSRRGHNAIFTAQCGYILAFPCEGRGTTKWWMSSQGIMPFSPYNAAIIPFNIDTSSVSRSLATFSRWRRLGKHSRFRVQP